MPQIYKLNQYTLKGDLNERKLRQCELQQICVVRPGVPEKWSSPVSLQNIEFKLFIYTSIQIDCCLHKVLIRYLILLIILFQLIAILQNADFLLTVLPYTNYRKPQCVLPRNISGIWLTQGKQFRSDVHINETHITFRTKINQFTLRNSYYSCQQSQDTRFMMTRVTEGKW